MSNGKVFADIAGNYDRINRILSLGQDQAWRQRVVSMLPALKASADGRWRTFSVPDDPDRVSAQIIFRVDDCRRTYGLLSSRGAEFLTAPVDRGGEIRAFFRDPDGHLFEISQLT